MGWKGMAIGGWAGWLLGGTLGSIFGAYLGSAAENRWRRGRRPPVSALRDPLAEAYSILGANEKDSNAELTRKYRELAKKNHPDLLRAAGCSEAKVAKATERMSRINSAWTAVSSARGI